MVLIDREGKLRATRLTQSLQLRVYHKNDLGHPFAFKLGRADLFAGRNGGLHAVTAAETTYFDFQVRGNGAVDPFEVEPKKRWRVAPLMDTCQSCHGRVEGNGIHSVNAVYTVAAERTGLTTSDLKEQVEATLDWHRHTYTWGLLQGLWGASGK